MIYTNPAAASLQTYYVSIRGQCWFTVSMQHKVCKVTLKLPSSRIGLGLLVQGCICIIRSSHGFNAPVLPATASTGISWAWTTLGLNCWHCPIIRVLATFSLHWTDWPSAETDNSQLTSRTWYFCSKWNCSLQTELVQIGLSTQTTSSQSLAGSSLTVAPGRDNEDIQCWNNEGIIIISDPPHTPKYLANTRILQVSSLS